MGWSGRGRPRPYRPSLPARRLSHDPAVAAVQNWSAGAHGPDTPLDRWAVATAQAIVAGIDPPAVPDGAEHAAGIIARLVHSVRPDLDRS